MAGNEISNADVFERLGGLVVESQHAKESRRVLHEKLDETISAQSRLNAKLDVTNEIATQGRDVAQSALDNIHRFEREFHDVHKPAIAAAARTAESVAKFQTNAEPMIEFMRIIKNIVLGIVGVMGISIVGFVAMLMWAREQLGIIIRFIIGF